MAQLAADARDGQTGGNGRGISHGGGLRTKRRQCENGGAGEHETFGEHRAPREHQTSDEHRAPGEHTSWQQAHETLLKLAAERAGLDFDEGRWLLVAFRSGTHIRLGYGSFAEYAERIFGYSPRLTQEKLRVAEALEELPETAREHRTGKICFSAVRELTRVATPATEREWLAAAEGRAVREIEQLVSGHRPGSRPDDLPDPSLKRHVLRLEVSGEALATFREAMAKIRRDAGEPLDDDAAILLLSRHVLGGPRDEGRSSYQVALTVCETCRRGRQHGRGELVDVSPEVVEMALCDAQHIGRIDGGDDDHPEAPHIGKIDGDTPLVGATDPGDAHVRAAGVNSMSVNSMSVDSMGVDSEGDAHASQGKAKGSVRPSDPHVDVGRQLARAVQSIPPAVRRSIRHRDSGRCVVPGCRHATFVDAHHLRLRSEGASNEAANLVTLCGAHHRASHQGTLVVEGSPATGLRFRHADGTPYGGSPSPAAADARTKAFQALVGMGYRESEAKRALASPHVSSEASVDLILRKALQVLARALTGRPTRKSSLQPLPARRRIELLPRSELSHAPAHATVHQENAFLVPSASEQCHRKLSANFDSGH